MRVRSRSVLFLLPTLLAASGCGYKLAGATTFLPPHIRVIAVTPFENRTQRPEIDQRVTEEVTRELSRRGRYRVVTDRVGADALLEGSITDFRTNPVQFNVQGRATKVQTVVTLQATLRDLSNDQVLWSQAGLLFREEYDVPETDAGFLDQETLALDEIARGAAGLLVTSILEGF
jgi:TolB-like protein